MIRAGQAASSAELGSEAAIRQALEVAARASHEMINVLPRINSLIGIPKQIAAAPALATTIPSINKITDMTTASA